MYIQINQSLRLVLASRSASRRAILKGAGLEYEAIPADLDETSLLAAYAKAGLSMEDRATALALAKAQAVQQRIADPEAVVIGSDQILEFDGCAYETPIGTDEARDRLKALCGKRHFLVCGAAVVRGTQEPQTIVQRVCVQMRRFSDSELETYLKLAPPSALQTVGAYALEGIGARLIEKIEGDWFSALGLPLWPLLSMLRSIEDGELS